MASRFTWFDLMTTDPAAAIAFYGTTLGVGTQVWDGPMPYTMFTRDGVPFGGVMQLPEVAKAMGAPSHWLGYVGVTDLVESLAKAVSLGATVLVPSTEVPNSGRFAVLSDPQKAVFALYQSLTGGGGANKAVSWHELVNDDVEAGIAFYGALFGWNKTSAMDMGPMGTYQMFGEGTDSFGGMMKRPPGMPSNAWSYYHNEGSVAPAAQVAGCSRTEEYLTYFAGSAGSPQRSAAGCQRDRMRKLFFARALRARDLEGP